MKLKTIDQNLAYLRKFKRQVKDTLESKKKEMQALAPNEVSGFYE